MSMRNGRRSRGSGRATVACQSRVAHPKRARSPYVHWVHLPAVRMRGIDQSTGVYGRACYASSTLRKMTKRAQRWSRTPNSFLTSSSRGKTRDCRHHAPTSHSLRGVEQNTMQRLINVNVWGTEPSLLHCQHLEISEEHDRGQEVERTLPQTDSVAQCTGSLLGTSTVHDPQSVLPSQGPRM